MDKEMCNTLFTSYIWPNFQYTTQVWSLHIKKYKDLIQKIQGRAAKIVPEVRQLSYRTRLKAINLPTMEEKRIILAFKFLNHENNVNRDQFFKRWRQGWTWDHSKKLSNTFVRKDVKRYFCSIRVVDAWNTLSDEIENADSIQKFKGCIIVKQVQ